MDDKKSNTENVDYNDGVHDYYDANGKIATVRKRRSVEMYNFKKQKMRIKNVVGSPKRVRRSYHKKDLDPVGRSYYFSTYRRKGFSPDHWKKQLSK